MNRMIPVTLSIIAAALAGCGGDEIVRPIQSSAVTTPTYVVTVPHGTVVAPAVVAPPAVTYVQPGTVVQSVPVPVLRVGYGSIDFISITDSNGYRRMTLRMDDGSAQVIETQALGLRLGDRVEITPDARMRYPLASR